MTNVQVGLTLDQQQREGLFSVFFVDGDETVIRLKKQALGCELEHTRLRILSWRMFLGLLSTPPRVEEWLKEISKQREVFPPLREKYKHDDRSGLDNLEEDPNINNPLSLDASSPWSMFFADEKVRKLISQDIDRTYPEYSFFKQQWVKDMMMDILFTYAKEHEVVSYRQGMHELLAPIIYMLDQEKMVASEKSVLSQLMDGNQLQNDAYIIFERLMKGTGSWFLGKNSGNDKDKESQTDSPIILKCQNIFHNILKAKDPGLYSYLCSLKIEPQLFLLRWIRVLFGREFKLNETLELWDSIFAYDKNLTLVDYIAVAMIISIRDKILSTDQNGVLQLLFKFPVENTMCSFVDTALSMAKPKPKYQRQTPLQSASTPPRPALSSLSPQFRLLPKSIWEGSLSVPNPITTASSNNNNTSNHAVQLQHLKQLHLNVAERLEHIVNLMQSSIIPVANELESADSIILAIAELKQIKDVLSGNLPLEVLPSSLSGRSPRK